MEPPQQPQQPQQLQEPQVSQPQFQPPAQQPQQPQLQPQQQPQQQPQSQQFQQPDQLQQTPQTPEASQNPQSQEPQQPQPPGQAETPPSYPPLPAPPDALFRTEVEAVQAVKAFAQVHQYAVITKRTNKGREGKVEAIYMTCDQGQTYRSSISHHKTDNLWHVKVRDPTHNHGPSQPGQHPSIRREEISQKTQYIKALLDINMPPSQILKQLRHVDPSTVIQIRDIYNLRHRLYQGKTPTPAVIISDFRHSAFRKRRAPEGSDNQSSGEASLPGAVESNGMGDEQGLATPVSGIPGTQDMHTTEQLLINTLF
ncbi:hypothetical protein BDW74DRAFT_143795 [Aspergillus multicolor]|uniref:uncharacterized protein n=1 Tax=Aspergillus multicolor TaxID=41759 RepID=UPI003CCDEFDB